MNIIRQLLILTFIGSICFFGSFNVQGKANEQALSKARQAQLNHMVRQDCGSCHGMTLKGGLGPALTKDALKNKPFLLIKNTILFGRPGTAMPPWKSIITEQEATWISQQLMQGMKNDK